MVLKDTLWRCPPTVDQNITFWCMLLVCSLIIKWHIRIFQNVRICSSSSNTNLIKHFDDTARAHEHLGGILACISPNLIAVQDSFLCPKWLWFRGTQIPCARILSRKRRLPVPLLCQSVRCGRISLFLDSCRVLDLCWYDEVASWLDTLTSGPSSNHLTGYNLTSWLVCQEFVTYEKNVPASAGKKNRESRARRRSICEIFWSFTLVF